MFGGISFGQNNTKKTAKNYTTIFVEIGLAMISWQKVHKATKTLVLTLLIFEFDVRSGLMCSSLLTSLWEVPYNLWSKDCNEALDFCSNKKLPKSHLYLHFAVYLTYSCNPGGPSGSLNKAISQ